MRVDISDLPSDNWHHFLRLRDLRQILSEVPLDSDHRVLELGAGDGAQTAELRKVFREVVPMDIAPSGDVEGMVIADVAELPLEDDSFDLIFSSNVLEHVTRLDDAFEEMKRVLTPDGMMIHSMPTGTWKSLQLGLRPVASVVKIVRRLTPGLSSGTVRASEGSHGSLDGMIRKKRSLLPRVIGLAVPTVHGESGSHLAELFAFRPRHWRKLFDNAEIECIRSSPLFFHSAYDLMPYRFLELRDLIARKGNASVDVFWLRPKD